MIVLVSGATATMRDIRPEHLGVLIVPSEHRAQSVPPGLTFAVDNSAFSAFDCQAYVNTLERWRGKGPIAFCAAPDVVADPVNTLRLFRLWEPMLHALHYPVAFVAQDGCERGYVPWAECEALFIGGTTDWKLGPEAEALARETKRLGKWLHMGRVNTRRRIKHARRIGCDSIDGTGWSKFPDINIPKAQRWIAEATQCPTLL